MEDYASSMPHSSQGGEQFPVGKMPAALPNGAPPQWGQELDLKSTATSHNVSPINASNGTRSSSQLSHPGSLSSHSSRDSSPAPSRLGSVNPNAWSPNQQNHSNQTVNDGVSSNPNRFQHPSVQTSPFSSGLPTIVNHSQPGAPMPATGHVLSGPQRGTPTSIPPASMGPTVSQNNFALPSTSQTQAGNQSLFSTMKSLESHGQQMPANSTGPSSSSGVFHQNSVGSSHYSQAPSQQARPLVQQPSHFQNQGQNLAAQVSQNSATPNTGMIPTQKVPPNSEAPMQMPAGVMPQGIRQMPPGQQLPSSYGQMPPRPTFPVSQGQNPPQQISSVQQVAPGQQITPGPGNQIFSGPGKVQSGQQIPLGLIPPVQQNPAGSGQVNRGPGQVPFSQQGSPGPGSMSLGQQFASGSTLNPLGQQNPALGQMQSGQQFPPRPGQLPAAPQNPPGQQIPGVMGPMPPRQQIPAGQQMASGNLPQRPMPPGQFPPGPSPLGQLPPVQLSPGQLPPGQVPPGQLPPGQLPPGQLPPGQFPSGHLSHGQLPPGYLPQGPSPPGILSSGSTNLGLTGVNQRTPYQGQQGQASSPPSSQPYSSQQPMNVPNYAQPSQSLSGPALQRPQQTLGPSGQYLPNHPAQPLVNQASGLVANDMSHRRYPQHPSQQVGPDSLTGPMSNMSVTQTGFNKLWGQEHFDLVQSRNILPPEKIEAPKIKLLADFQSSINCSPDIFRCTVTKIPETDSLLKKSRLPLGVLIHPFRDLNNLPVIQCTPIVRCRVCRTYINPFVYFMDEKHWKCNLCFRGNELPDEFHFDPATKTYGEPMRRPEVKSATIEFIAPAEYMLRPPQPAVYLFLLDVSRLAVESGYLQLVCETLLNELERLPGDSRTSVGFITYDSSVHFYSLAEGLSAPQQMVVMDIDDIFLPCPDNLLANLGERKALIRDMLLLLPSKFTETYDTGSALGAALQAAFKLMSPTGGRVTVFQCCLPNIGPGALKAREDPANRASSNVPHLNPATDFYKQLALEFSGQQTAVDLFLLNQQYSDLATISGVSRFSGGCIYHFPLFKSSSIQVSESFELAFRRYLERKIGFEAVMRIRCSRGLSIHTFHGNFYVRSTDLLSLPNINPDAGFGMQVSIEENLSDMQTVCFQAALLYTSGKGERRIRVHTLCLPIAASLPDILHSADQQCIIGLLAKMAVDRSQQSSLSDARDAFINVVIDALSAYKLTQSSVMGAGLLAPHSLRLLPLYILALLKSVAFRSGTTTRLDDRVFAMCQMKTLPLHNLIQFIYPDLYPVYCLDQYEEVMVEGVPVAIPPRLHLSAEKVNSHGAFLLDAGDQILLLIGRAIPAIFCENILGVSSFSAIPEDMFELPEIDCEDSRRMRNFLSYLQSEKPYCATIHVIREDSKLRSKFFDRLIEDRTESSYSYYEFLQHIKNHIK